MRTPLALVFAASLVGNIALGIYAVRHSTQPPASDAIVSTETRADAKASPGATVVTGAPTSTATPTSVAALSTRDPKGMLDTLRAAGFSPGMLRSVAYQLAREHISQDPSDIAPYWKRESFDPANRQARIALEREREAFVEQILGDDARPSVALNAGQRQRQFGNLSGEKIDAIARIERDYNEVRQTAQAAQAGQINGVDRVQEMMRSQELLEQEKRADLAAVLTPDELEQYDMRNSRTASNVMNAARLVDLSESEYEALYRSQKQFDDANPRMMGPIDPEAMAQRNLAQDSLNERAREILGDDRFYRYLEASDGNYSSVARFATQENIPPATAYEVYKVQREMQNTLMQFSRGQNGTPPSQRAAEMQSLAATYEARLQQLLSPQALEAYRKQGFGRMLNSMSRMNTNGAMPAVRLPGG